MDFPTRLIQARRAAGYTQSGVADALKISRGIVNAWEVRNRSPSASNLLAASRLLRVSPFWLLAGEGDRELFGGDIDAGRLAAVLGAILEAVTEADVKISPTKLAELAVYQYRAADDGPAETPRYTDLAAVRSLPAVPALFFFLIAL